MRFKVLTLQGAIHVIMPVLHIDMQADREAEAGETDIDDARCQAVVEVRRISSIADRPRDGLYLFVVAFYPGRTHTRVLFPT